MAFVLNVEWGERSRTLRRQLISKISGDSFLLQSPGAGPVSLHWISPLDIANWDSVVTPPVPLTRNGNDTAVSAQLVAPTMPDPDNPLLSLNTFYLRLDFSLSVTVAGQSAVVLALRQLFLFNATTGALGPVQCAVDDVVLKPSTSGPVPASGAAPRRRYSGLHPLLSVLPGKISVNAEFVDLTALWWSLRKDKIGWYLHPAMKGRQTALRVLGWTAGGNPMLWFAVIPDAAIKAIMPAKKEDGPAADLIFFRPQAGINAFPYTPDEKGLLNPEHDDRTLYILARYLLSPLPAAELSALKSAGILTAPNVSALVNRLRKTSLAIPDIDLLADQLQPFGGTAGAPIPSDPIDIARGLPWCFQLVGLESAFNRAGGNRVLFLPLASGDTTHTYEGATLPNARASLRSALGTLWNARAIDRDNSAIPELGNRELWLAGHSGANLSMWACAQANAGDVARMISFDATSWVKNLAGGINTIRLVAKARHDAHKGLDVFAIVSPNLSQSKSNPPAGHPFQGLDDDTDQKLRATGAMITVLPDFARRETYWKPVPVSTPKSFLQHFLGNWSDAQLAASAANPERWRYLFFHELAVYGGDLIPAPAGAPPGTPPTRKTFFEQALGPASPRPPL